MLHIAAGVYDLQHLLQGDNIESENGKNMDAGENCIANERSPSVVVEMDLQKPLGVKTERDANLIDEVIVIDGHVTATDEKSESFTGKVQQLVTMDLVKLANSERARGEVKEAPDHLPKDPKLLQDSHLLSHQPLRRSCSPESQMSDLNRSFTSTPSLGDSPTEVKEEPMFEGETSNRLAVGSKTSKSHHESVMTDSGIYEHDILESDIPDAFIHGDDRRRFVESVSGSLAKAFEDTNTQEQAVGSETLTFSEKDNLNSSQSVQTDLVQKQSKDKPSEVSDQKIESSLEGSNSFNLSWFDSSSNDFYISSVVKGSGDSFAEFDPKKQSHTFSDSQSPSQNSGFPTDRRKKMVMYIEGLKRKPNSESTFNADEDELAAYIYDPQINDTYHICLMKTDEFFTDPFDEILRRIDRDEKEGQKDPLEDPDFAMPSPSSPVIIPPDYEGDDGEFFMEVMPPFGDVSSMRINYQFEMQDATWGVSSEEAYFDLLTGERILSTIYEFEVSSEEDTDSVRMAESRHGHREESVTAFRQDSLEEDDVFSQYTESLDNESIIEENYDKSTVNLSETINQLLTTEGEKPKDDDLKESVDSNLVKSSTYEYEKHDESETTHTHGENNGDHSQLLESDDAMDMISFNETSEANIHSESETANEIAKEYERENAHLNQSDMEGEDDSEVPSDEVHNTSTPNETETDEVNDTSASNETENDEDINESTELSGESDVGINTNVHCINEETPDIIVTTAEDDYNSEEEFYTTDTFISIREQYKCNATAACIADTCICDKARSDDDEDLLSIPHTEIEIISDTECEFAASNSGDESDGTSISVTEYDFTNAHDENEDVETSINNEGDGENVINAVRITRAVFMNTEDTDTIGKDGNRESCVMTNNRNAPGFMNDSENTDVFTVFESVVDAKDNMKSTVSDINLTEIDADDLSATNAERNAEERDIDRTDNDVYVNNAVSDISRDKNHADKAKVEIVEERVSETELLMNFSDLRLEDKKKDKTETDSADLSKTEVKQTEESGVSARDENKGDLDITDNSSFFNERLIKTDNVSPDNSISVSTLEKNNSEVEHTDNDKNAVAHGISFNNTEAQVISSQNVEALVTSSVNSDNSAAMFSNSVAFYKNDKHTDADVSNSDLNAAVANDHGNIDHKCNLEKVNASLLLNLDSKSTTSSSYEEEEKVIELEEEVIEKLTLLDKSTESSSVSVCKEKHHVTNETENINETVENLIIPGGGIAKPVNVCCENLVTQESVLNDTNAMSECSKAIGITETAEISRKTTPGRRLSFTKTTAIVEEECEERTKINIGSKHKISCKNEEECAVKHRRNNESICENVYKEETSDPSQIEEELEICVPAAPPLRTKRLLLRRFSSEPKTHDQIRTNRWLTDLIKNHTIDPDFLQPPERPKRKKETQITPMTPPRKNRSVSRLKNVGEACKENAVLERALSGATENEKQSGENLKDGVGAGDSRSSSVGVETNGETQGKRAGTWPDPRDPGTKNFGWNINQTMHEKPDLCGARLHEFTAHESYEKCEGDSERSADEKGDNGFVFTRPIKVSEIVASLVLESPKFSRSKPPKIKSYITSRKNSGNQYDAFKENEGDETVKEDKDKVLQETARENINDILVVQDDVAICEKLNINEDNKSAYDQTWSPRPPKRKKKTSPLICNSNQQHLVDAASEIAPADGMIDKSCPPKVPERTYRRAHSLPRRPKSRRNPSSPYYSRGGGKAVTRSATTATCRPHNTPNDLKFAVPEISSVINYDPLVRSQEHRRASVTLLDEPESPETIERHLAFRKGIAPTPHIRKRHHTADLPNSEWKRRDVPKRKSSIKRISSFSLPRTLVKKLTNQSYSSDTTNCFPNPFSRKHKDNDAIYSPQNSTDYPQAEKPISRPTSTKPKDTFSELFSHNSSLDNFEGDQVIGSCEKKKSIFDDDDDEGTCVNNDPECVPLVPPRRNKKNALSLEVSKDQENDKTGECKDGETEGNNEISPEESVFKERTHSEVEKDVSQDTENNEATESQDEETKEDESSTNEEETEKTPLYLKTYYLKGFREETEASTNNESGEDTDSEISRAKRQNHSWKIDEINEGNILDDSGIDFSPEDFTGKLLVPPHVATPVSESWSDDEFRRLEKEVNEDYEKTLSQIENSQASVEESETPNTQVLELETYPWEPPVVPLRTWAERQGVQEPVFPSLNLRHQSTQTQNDKNRRSYESAEKYTQYTPSPGPPVESEKDEAHNHQQQEKSSKRDDDSRVQQDRCIEVYPETVRQRQRNMMSSSNKVDIKNWTSGSGNDTLTSPAKVKKFLPSVKALRNQFETGKTNNNKPDTNGGGVINNGTLSRKSSTSNSSITSSTLEKTSSTNSLNSTNGSTENLITSNIENSRPIDPDEPVEPIYSQFKKVDEELKELMSKPPSTTGWNPRPLLKRLYYVPEAPKHHSQGTTYINIEGYLEKLPSGRKKATFWNAWKRRYFVAKDGVLYYYQNPQAEKASMKMTLMGGKVECMEPSMVGVDDGKGHYVVVRCSSRQEAERWRRALETHTVEDFASQYVQPWPIPTNPALLRDTLVIDLGSSSVRAGVLATQATLPQVFLPSVVATERESRRQIWGFDALSPDVRSVSSIAFPIRPSHKISKYSVDLSAVSSLLQKAFADLKVDPKNYNIQLSVPRILNPNTQTELLRVLFDKYGVKSVNLTHQSILALYAYNATSGIVVDIGERMDIVPVIDGYIVDGGVSRVPYGGYRILDHLRQFLYMRNVSLINEVESYIIRHVLENICYCAHHYNTEKARCTNNSDNFEKGVSLAEYFQGKDCPYEYISLDFGRFQATEGLFNPDAWGLDHPGIHKLIHKAIMECSMDIRKEMSRSIFLAGGVTQLPGLVDRLTTEIDNLTPPAIRPKVHASPYRYHAAYIGACVLAESPAFTQSRITREEWNKQGSSALRKWSL